MTRAANEPACRTCRFLGPYEECRRHAPAPQDEIGHYILAWLAKIAYPEELNQRSIHDLRDNLVEVSFRTEVNWPHILHPDEMWCGDWQKKENETPRRAPG